MTWYLKVIGKVTLVSIDFTGSPTIMMYDASSIGWSRWCSSLRRRRSTLPATESHASSTTARRARPVRSSPSCSRISSESAPGAPGEAALRRLLRSSRTWRWRQRARHPDGVQTARLGVSPRPAPRPAGCDRADAAAQRSTGKPGRSGASGALRPGLETPPNRHQPPVVHPVGLGGRAASAERRTSRPNKAPSRGPCASAQGPKRAASRATSRASGPPQGTTQGSLSSRT